jgi:AcrR family transcriptional regulator
MSASAGQGRVRMARDERQDQILHVAAELFGERPYSQVSVNDIAQAAGVARGLMHHYFGSKRELYLEVVRLSARLPPVRVPAGEGETADELWPRAVDGFLGMIGKNPDLWLASVTVGGAERDDEVTAILDEAREILADQTLVAIGLDDRADDPVARAFVRAWGGFVQELTIEWLGRQRLDRERVRAAMVATLPILVEQVLPILDDPAG